MNKYKLCTNIKNETYEKLKALSIKENLNMGQLIDYMTSKQKYIR